LSSSQSVEEGGGGRPAQASVSRTGKAGTHQTVVVLASHRDNVNASTTADEQPHQQQMILKTRQWCHQDAHDDTPRLYTATNNSQSTNLAQFVKLHSQLQINQN
jgi:hypothetical protein